MWGSSDGTAITEPIVSHPLAASTVGAVVLLWLASAVAVPVPALGGLIVATVLVVGPVAGVGGAAGVIIHDLFLGAVGSWTVSLAVWLVGFCWLVAWLAPAPPPGRDRGASTVHVRRIRWTLVAVFVAGILATALGAWVGLAVGGQRFYLTAAGLLVGLPVAVAGAIALELIGRPSGRWNDANSLGDTSAPASAGGAESVLLPERQWKPSILAALGLVVVGLGWLGGAGLLDVVGHDLAIFSTEQELRRYAATTFGSGSPLAALGTTTMLAVYRYSAVGVLLSGPLVAGVVWVIHRRQRLRAGEAE